MDARLIITALLLLPAVLAVYLAGQEGGSSAAVYAAVAALLALVLAARATTGSTVEERLRIRRLADAALPFVPGLLIVVLGFNAGGFAPGATALVAVALASLLAVRVALAEDPFGGIGWLVAIGGAALALYAGWSLLSGSWSGAESRALIEFDRALLYLLALLLMGSARRTDVRIRHLVWGLALGALVVCTAGLVSRVLPDVLSTTPTISNERLSYPIGYWNAVGLLAAIGVVLCFHLASSEREPRALRIVGSAAVPPLAATLLFTFSRGAILTGAGGLVVYAVLARPRGLLSGILASVPAGAIAVVAAYRADALATENPTSPAAISQGHHAALVVVLCSVAAAVLRTLSLPVDTRLSRIRIGRGVRLALLASALVAALVVSLALDAPGALHHQYERFVGNVSTGHGSAVRDRLTDVGNNGRIDYWKVARRGFAEARLEGQGAGTYETYWARHATITSKVDDAHSLYFEVLGELGLVGLCLLVVAVGTILATLGAHARGPMRAVYGALFAAGVVWAVHAGVDWDWEMPVVTAWVFAAGGAALARGQHEGATGGGPHPLVRAATILLLFGVAAVPTVVGLSQMRIDDAVTAYSRGDCATARDEARSAISLPPPRSEPFEILSYCDARARRRRPSIRHIGEAIAHDRDNWEYHYDLAVVRAALGLDPRPAIGMARRLNPREPVVEELAEVLGIRDRRLRARRARSILGRLSFIR